MLGDLPVATLECDQKDWRRAIHRAGIPLPNPDDRAAFHQEVEQKIVRLRLFLEAQLVAPTILGDRQHYLRDGDLIDAQCVVAREKPADGDDKPRMTPDQKRKIWGIAIGIWGGKPKGEKLTKEEMAMVRGHLERMCVGPEWDLNRLTVKQADTMIETLKSMEGDDIPW